MSVVAKFRVYEVTSTSKARVNEKGEREAQGRIKLGAVYASDSQTDSDALAEDIAFSLATPSGTIEMNVSNADALEQFQPGDEFYVRFDKAE